MSLQVEEEKTHIHPEDNAPEDTVRRKIKKNPTSPTSPYFGGAGDTKNYRDLFTVAAKQDNFVASHQETQSQATNSNGPHTMILRLSSKRNVIKQNKHPVACIIIHNISIIIY